MMTEYGNPLRAQDHKMAVCVICRLQYFFLGKAILLHLAWTGIHHAGLWKVRCKLWRGINANMNIMRYGIYNFSDDICNLPGD